ncbi:unnamed protein product [Trichogramma brassicae]|uniref:Uncharacterized protein n=1 Tax=Trichogramma brassicae TaxID=86971 RepID=A0A6H5IBF5_9HYME|nr:unnamed protein product [Trichogramma brassicae]
MAQDNQECLKKLKLVHRTANGSIERISYKFLRKLYPLIKTWRGRHPNLLDTFRHEEIDWLLKEAAKNIDNAMNLRFVKFVVRSGYTNEPPRLDEDGNPISRRTTGLHYVDGRNPEFVECLFDIYTRFDVNYTDEDGLTHFHLACRYGLKHIAKAFLALGQDPNCLTIPSRRRSESGQRQGTDDSARHRPERPRPGRVGQSHRQQRSSARASQRAGQARRYTAALGAEKGQQEGSRAAAEARRRRESGQRGGRDSSARHLQERGKDVGPSRVDRYVFPCRLGNPAAGTRRRAGQAGPDTAAVGRGESLAPRVRQTRDTGSGCVEIGFSRRELLRPQYQGAVRGKGTGGWDQRPVDGRCTAEARLRAGAARRPDDHEAVRRARTAHEVDGSRRALVRARERQTELQDVRENMDDKFDNKALRPDPAADRRGGETGHARGLLGVLERVQTRVVSQADSEVVHRASVRDNDEAIFPQMGAGSFLESNPPAAAH